MAASNGTSGEPANGVPSHKHAKNNAAIAGIERFSAN